MAIQIQRAAAARSPGGAPAAPASPEAGAAGLRLGFRPRATGKDLIYFTSQLSLLLEVGISLTDAVRALEAQTANPVLRPVLRAIVADTEAGQPFSAALARHPQVFDGVFVSMVRAGEAGGYLRDALERNVEMREKREALLAHVRATLAYPVVLGIMSLLVVVLVLTSVLPKFMPLFVGKERILPLSTRLLMGLSQSLRAHWWVYLLAAGAAAAGAYVFVRSPYGRALRDRLTLTLPLIGPLSNKVLTGQMLRTLGHLLESHVPLTDALTVTRLTVQNDIYRRFIDRTEETVRSGGRLALAFRDFSHIPGTVRQMIATAEEAGNLYRVMLRLAKHYDAEIEQQLKRVASMIEPIALIFLGGIVGLIVASVILPLFKLAHAIG